MRVRMNAKSEMAANPLLQLRKLGQSVWLDDIGRAMLDDGSLARLIEADGIAGVTSNPSIFAASINKDPQYQRAIAELLPTQSSDLALYETLTIEDLRRAADLFRRDYEGTSGGDGYVSMEVSPHLAYDTAGSLAEAKRLWALLQRQNAMIKIPGTAAGLAAIRDTIAAGINVNVTLLFSPERYRAVANAYFEGLETRLAAGKSIDQLASVASFFLSRIDTLVDKQLDELTAQGQKAAQELRGTAAIASACRAYAIYEELLASPRWKALAGNGGRPQRLLWASTSAKDPTYSPVKYVEELIAPDTVNTMPLETVNAYRRLGRPELRLEAQIAPAAEVFAGLQRLGIDMAAVAMQLEREGVRKFIEPFDKLQASLADRRIKQKAG
ncbi:MAG: transaldolase [Gammaproteobacteria bacterium]|nr:transaldolase [Gammaproteobacteria bacterium]